MDITALQETRLSEEGQLREEGGGYTFFWKGREANLPRIHGVGFAIKNELVSQLTELPVGINERLMTVRIQTGNNSYATLVSAYAPTLAAEEPIKELFYSDLDRVLTSISSEDQIYLLGDFNARVGRDHEIWRRTIGKNGTGKVNSNGTLLLSKCAEHNLTITNTLFRQKEKLKTSWQHPRSKHWHLIDYIITRTRDIKFTHLTRSSPLTENCWTDHRLIYSKVKMNIKKKKVNPTAPKRFKLNVNLLKEPSTNNKFQQAFIRQLPKHFPQNTEEHWESLKTAITKTCKETIGLQKHRNEDWFDRNDGEITKLVEETRKTLSEHLKDPNCAHKKKKHRELKAQVQRVTREMKNTWWVEKSKEMQQYANNNDMKNFFSATKKIYGPSTQGLAPLKSKDGTKVLKTNKEVLSRWQEHFDELLNRNPIIDENAIHEIPQHRKDESLGKLPTLEEVEIAIKAMKNNKASGPDNIPAEIFKNGGPLIISQLHKLIVKIWINEEIPKDLRDGLIITIYKKKGDRSDCGNHRGITLLSIAGKILTRILNSRLSPLAENILPESQYGFRPSRGTTDMIFTARQLQEKCREQNQPLYMAFIDLTKAFDSVGRELLWKILSKAGCPEKFIKIMRLLHDDMTAVVISNGEATDSFGVNSGVKQGCVAAPTLFSIFIAAVLHLVRDKLPPGILMTYRMDGGIFNLSRLKAKTKTKVSSIIELQYADDNAICALKEEDLQIIINAFADAYSKLGLTINVKKTQVLHQPAPNVVAQPPNININGQKLENVDKFIYLGSNLSSKANIDDEISYRLRCANAAFGKLSKRVFEDRDLRTETKIMVYHAVVLPTLLYASETWTTYRRHIKDLERFHQRCLRKILKVSWETLRTNLSILEQSGCTSIEYLITKNQLRWAGHLVRRQDSFLPKQIFYSELTHGRRHVGRPRKRFKDELKENLKKCDIDPKNWEHLAEDRKAWRREVKDGVEHFEIERHRQINEKRDLRIARRENPPAMPLNPFYCPICNKACAARIGLTSHMRTHQR